MPFIRLLFPVLFCFLPLLSYAGNSAIYAQNDSNFFAVGQLKSKLITFTCESDGEFLSVAERYNQQGSILSRQINNPSGSTYFNYLIPLENVEYEYEAGFVKSIKTTPSEGAAFKDMEKIYKVLDYDDEGRPVKAITQTINTQPFKAKEGSSQLEVAYDSWRHKGSKILHIYSYVDADNMVVEKTIMRGPYNSSHSTQSVYIYEQDNSLKSVYFQREGEEALREVMAVEKNEFGLPERVRNDMNEVIYKYHDNGNIASEEIYSSLGIFLVKYKFSDVHYDTCGNLIQASLETFRFDDQMKKVLKPKSYESMYHSDKNNSWGACKEISMNVKYDYAEKC